MLATLLLVGVWSDLLFIMSVDRGSLHGFKQFQKHPMLYIIVVPSGKLLAKCLEERCKFFHYSPSIIIYLHALQQARSLQLLVKGMTLG